MVRSCRAMPDTRIPSDDNDRHVRGPLALSLLALLGLALFASFVALGTWQVHRLAWKTALIAHVDERVHASPVPAPGPADWAGVTVANAEYRHVQLSGSWLVDRQTRVWTATDAGSGYWILTPLRRDDGSIVLVNRGFAPAGWCDLKGHCPAPPEGEVTVTGLLRIRGRGAVLRGCRCIQRHDLAAWRHDGDPLPQPPPQLPDHLVRAGADGAGCCDLRGT